MSSIYISTDTTLSLASNNASVGIGVQSPRYDACYYFSAKSYLKFPNPIYAKKTIYGLTINMWVRLDSGCGGYATILSGLNNPTSNFPWLAVNTEQSGLWSYIWSNTPQYGRGMSNELLKLDISLEFIVVILGIKISCQMVLKNTIVGWQDIVLTMMGLYQKD